MKHHILKSRGFTMIELIVSIGILTLMTGVVLAKYHSFSTNALFVNANEDIVLALRQTQVYAAGTKGGGSACGASPFECVYGVHFSATTPNGVIVFVDKNNNKNYDTGEEIETIVWNPAISITGIKCSVTTDDCVGGVMDVTFKRPNPDAYIRDLATNTPPNFSGYKGGWITLADANTGKTLTIAISLAGQISIQ